MELVSIPTVAFDNVQVSILVIDQEAYSDHQPEHVEQFPIRNEVSALDEETQQLQELVPLRRSTKNKISAILDYFVVNLLEHEENS